MSSKKGDFFYCVPSAVILTQTCALKRSIKKEKYSQRNEQKKKENANLFGMLESHLIGG